MLLDQSEERGEAVWSDCVEGACVLLECHSRWYLGVVRARSQLTVRLGPALCGHDLGDLGLFLDGRPQAAELTPLPRPIEVNLSLVESCQGYPAEAFAKINKRTHNPQGQPQ